MNFALIKPVAVLAILFGAASAFASEPTYSYDLLPSPTNTSNGSVQLTNWMTDTAIRTVSVGLTPINLTFNPNGKYLYTYNIGSNPFAADNIPTISVISAASFSVIKTIPVPKGNSLSTFAVSPDGKYIVAPNRDGSVTVVCAIANMVLGTWSFGSGFLRAGSVAFSPDGKFLYVYGYASYTANSAGAELLTVSTATHQVIRSVHVTEGGGGSSYPMLITPDGKSLYVAEGNAANQNSITWMSTVTTDNDNWLIIGDAVTEAFSITPDGKYVYASVYELSSGGYWHQYVVDTSKNTFLQNNYQPANYATAIGFTPDSQFAIEPVVGGFDFEAGPTYDIIDVPMQILSNSMPGSHPNYSDIVFAPTNPVK